MIINKFKLLLTSYYLVICCNFEVNAEKDDSTTVNKLMENSVLEETK